MFIFRKKILHLCFCIYLGLDSFHAKDLHAESIQSNYLENSKLYLQQVKTNISGVINGWVTQQFLTSEEKPIEIAINRSMSVPLLPSQAVVAPVPPVKRLWNLRDVDIKSVVQEISRDTGKNFIIDPNIKGKISIISSTPLSSKEAYQVFLSVLQVYGYAAIPSGNVIKIVTDVSAKELGMPLVDHKNSFEGDAVVARIITVKNISVDQLIPVLRPLMPPSGNIAAYGPGNVVILVGRSTNVDRLAAIIQRVDTENTDNIDVITLQNAQAGDLVQTIHNLQTNENKDQAPHISLAADELSNTILISGSKSARLKMKILISELDTPNNHGPGGNTQIINLHYLRAQDLVPILVGIAKSNFHGNVESVIGTITTSKDYSAVETGENISINSAASVVSNRASSIPASNGGTIPHKPQVGIIAEPNTNSIILNGPTNLLQILRSVILKLDVRPPQILVEALLAEVDEHTTQQLGIRWGTVTDTGFLGAIEPGFGIGKDGKFIQGIGIISRQGSFRNLTGVVEALQHDRNADILSTPAVVVLDNHEAKILVGQKVSIQQSSYPNNAAGTSNATPYTTFSRENVALHLFVTPQINQGKSIQLAIDAGDDSLQNPENPGTTPVVNTSAIKTSVLVNNGDILVLGGLTQKHVSKSRDTIPILGDIPVINYLVGANGKSAVKKNLLIFLRPVIILDPQGSKAITQAKYNYMRAEELAWQRKQYHCLNSEDKVILPPIEEGEDLPTPFHVNKNKR